jgi:DNA-binding MarR family transcriptional regulator
MTDDDKRVRFSFMARPAVVARLRKSAEDHGLSATEELARILDRHLPPLDASGTNSLKVDASEQKHRLKQRIEDEAWRIFRGDPKLAAAIVRLAKNPTPKLSGLTRKQADLLKFIREYASKHEGRTPPYQEMMTGIGLGSTSGVSRLVLGLEERGYISRTPRQAQQIKLI